MLFHIIDNDIRLQVEYFHLLLLDSVEELLDIVDRRRDVLSRRMPVRISQVTDGLLRLGLQPLDLFPADDISAVMHSTHVQHHPVRIIHTERMAVDAIIARHIIPDNRFLVKRFQITLINAHDMPFLIARFNQPIDQMAVDRAFVDMDLKRFPGFPAASFPRRTRERQAAAGILFEQLSPGIRIEAKTALAITLKASAFLTGDQDIQMISFTRQTEIQGRNIDRNSHIPIIRKDLRFFYLRRSLLGPLRAPRTSCQQQTAEQCVHQIPFMLIDIVCFHIPYCLGVGINSV